MEAVIKKNSTQTLIVDPRLYGGSMNWDEVLKNAVVTFSLYDVDSGCYVIASRAGEIIPGGLSENDAALTDSVSCGDDTTVTRIAYRFRSRDTKTSGVYRGTFQVNVIGEESVFAVPDSGDIQIVITESAIAPWSSTAFTGMDEILDAPTGPPVLPTASSLIALTWYELNVMRLGATLIPGQEYLLTDYQTIHRIPGTSQINTGPIEPLIIQAISATAFAQVAKSTLQPNDVIHYDFANEFVQCEDSFDTDSYACSNDNSVHRPGYIAYREDTVTQLSSHYDFRVYINRVNNVTGLTFGTSVSKSHAGKDSGNIIITTGSNYVIAENSRGLYLTKIANRVRIGNDVRQFSTSGVTVQARILPYTSFELLDSGLEGVVSASIPMKNSTTGFNGISTIGLIPAGCVLSSVQIVNAGYPVLPTATMGLGVQGVSDDEVFAPTLMSEVASGVFSAQVNTRPITTNAGLLLSLNNSGYGQGGLHIKAGFIYTSGFNSVDNSTPTPAPTPTPSLGHQFVIMYPAQSNGSSLMFAEPIKSGGHLAGIQPSLTREFSRSRIFNATTNQLEFIQFGKNDRGNASSTDPTSVYQTCIGGLLTYFQAFEANSTGNAAGVTYPLNGTPIKAFKKQAANPFAYNEIVRQINAAKAIWVNQMGMPWDNATVKLICRQGESHADDLDWVADLGQIWDDLTVDCGLPENCRSSVTLTASQTDSHNNTVARQHIQEFANTYTRHPCLAVDALNFNLQDEFHWDTFSHLKHDEQQYKALTGVQPQVIYISPVITCADGYSGAPKQAASLVSKSDAQWIATSNLVCVVANTSGGSGNGTGGSNVDPNPTAGGPTAAYLTRKPQQFTSSPTATVFGNGNSYAAPAGINNGYARARYALGPTSESIIGYIEYEVSDVYQVLGGNSGVNYILPGLSYDPAASASYDDFKAGIHQKSSLNSFAITNNGLGVAAFAAGYVPGFTPVNLGSIIRMEVRNFSGGQIFADYYLNGVNMNIGFNNGYNGNTLYFDMGIMLEGCQIKNVFIAGANLIDLD